MEFVAGIVVGTLVTGVMFIVFGKNNKNKIEKARKEIVDAYEHASNELNEESRKVVRRVKDSLR